uniref:hypothetical protein n=1 Tax=Paractinoplanes polyasparticus TaxID=2856853 RepID=UPI001C851AA4|nr:hypothetical protein [Actinoplanes polyasparticus]
MADDRPRRIGAPGPLLSAEAMTAQAPARPAVIAPGDRSTSIKLRNDLDPKISRELPTHFRRDYRALLSLH